MKKVVHLQDGCSSIIFTIAAHSDTVACVTCFSLQITRYQLRRIRSISRIHSLATLDFSSNLRKMEIETIWYGWRHSAIKRVRMTYSAQGQRLDVATPRLRQANEQTGSCKEEDQGNGTANSVAVDRPVETIELQKSTICAGVWLYCVNTSRSQAGYTWPE